MKKASDAIVQALKDHSFEIQSIELGKIVASSPSSLLSWGEDILVLIEGSSKQVTISITSEPKFQIFDWGKSKDNIEVLFDSIERILKSE